MNRVLRHYAALGPRCAALAATLALLAGCAATRPSGPHDGASTLSQAVHEAARGENDKHTELHNDPPRPAETSIDISVDAAPDCPECDAAAGPAPEPSMFQHLQLGLVSSVSSLGATPFRNAALTGIQIGARPSSQLELDVALMGSPMWLRPESGLSGGMVHPAEVALDGSIRYDLGPGRSGPTLYPIAGLRAGSVLWDYRHPIVADGSDPIESDLIGYVAPYAGVGVALVRSARFRLGAHVTTGYRVFEEMSEEGFRNDLFRDGSFTQLTVETSIRF